MQSVDKFIEIENKYKLYEKEVEGVCYWVYIRNYIFQSVIMKIKHDLKPAHNFKTKKLSDKLRIGVKLFYYSFVKYYKIPRKVDILVVTHPRRVKGEDGFYECCYTADITNHYDNCCILEFPDGYEHKRPIREGNIIYTDRAKVTSYLHYHCVKCFQRKRCSALKEKIIQDIRAPLGEMQEAEQIKFDEDIVINRLLKQVFIYEKRKKYYDKIIRKTQPKVIVEVISYAMDCMILNELGKKHGIPTVELQHGAMGERHMAYNYGKAGNIMQFPTYEFLFSDYWKETTPLPIDSDKIRVVGYPHYEHYLRSHQKPRTEKKGICFISSGDTFDLSYLAVDLSRRLDLDKWHIFYKLHPEEYAYWEDGYPWLAGTGIEVVDEKGKSLYEVFSLCEVQIGICSTALFEGLGFNLNTLIYKGFGSSAFQDLCDRGYAVYVENVDECMENLENDTHRTAKGFWKEDASENIICELDKIIEEQRI